MKKFLWLFLVSLLVLGASPLATQASSPNWRVEYYNNPALEGHPVTTVVEAKIDYDWGFGSPNIDVPSDYFSARWTSMQEFEEGTYLFFLTVDDGARVWLDGKLIIDAWDIGPRREQRVKIRIEEEGLHEIQVAYFEFTGHAVLKLDTLKLGGKDDIIGAWQGEYFNNRNLEGTPEITRQDGAISFDWGFGSPDARLAMDNFSARWTRSILLDRPGNYIFRMQHDDGMRVYVDGKIIYDSWYDQAVTYQVRQIALNSGFRTFTVEFYERTGNAVAFLSIEPDPGNYDRYAVDEDTEVGVIVDTRDIHFTWGGPADNRYVAMGGYKKGHYSWTTCAGPTHINFGRWDAAVNSAGNYEVFAYIPAEHSSATGARYLINHFGRTDERVINQSHYSNEYVSLGTYYFDGVSDEYVMLYDSTGDQPGTTEVAFDSLKFVRR